MKRVLLFVLVNILVVVSLSFLMNILGIGRFLLSAGIQYTALLIFCFFWGLIGSLISLMLSKIMAKWMMGIQLVTLAGPHKNLVETIHRLSRRAGLMEMPEVGIYQDSIPNAFATGPTRNNSLIAVSSGLLAIMEDHEIEGVLAHEVGHIANGDMITMALIQGVVNAFVMFFSRIVAYAIIQSMRDEQDKEEGSAGAGPFVEMILIFILDAIFGLLAMPIVAWFSRYREFRADRAGAKLAGKEKMISALLALTRAYPQFEEDIQAKSTHFKSLQISSKESVMRLFSTHPPIKERILLLEKLK